MPKVKTAPFQNLAELLDHLGGIHPSRVRTSPPFGRAKAKDVTSIQAHEDRTCELVDGILVEKAMGVTESFLAMHIGFMIQTFLTQHDLGLVFGPDGTVRIMPKLIRAPDVSFVSWDKLPGRFVPKKAIPDLVPDLAVEVISKSNTRGEMLRKLGEYFAAGVQLVWFVFPKKRTVRVYTSPETSTLFAEGEALDGGDVLPGLSLPLVDIFARMPPTTPAKGKRRRKPKS